MPARLYALALAVAAASMATAAQAQTVTIDDAVARVIYRPEDRADFQVSITGEGVAGLPPLRVARQGEDLVIDGDLDRRNLRSPISRCHNGDSGQPPASPGLGASVNVRGVGQLALSEAPLVIIRGPRDARIRTSGAVYGTVAPGPRNVDVGIAGCGAWVVANTEERLRVSVGGSGTVWTGTADVLDINIGGSGKVRATGAARMDVAIGGSGTVRLAHVDGPVGVAIGGSGTVHIASGNVPVLDAHIAGSGNIDFQGTAADLNARIMGAGTITVNRVTGNVSRSVVGVGRIRVND